jgi:hypothetical protein
MLPLGVGELTEITAESDPTADFTVTVNRLPSPLDPTALTTIELDDVHTVDLLDVTPTRPLSLTGKASAMEPTTVTLMLPVVAMFDGVADDTLPPMYVIANVSVPVCVLVVINALRDADDPDDDLPRTAVSDVHTVANLPVPPTRTTPLRSDVVPKLCDPTAVTLMAPVVAMLATTTALTDGPSNVTGADRLPTDPLVVITAFCTHAVDTPADGLSTTDVDDRQTVDADDVPPTRATSLASHNAW